MSNYETAHSNTTLSSIPTYITSPSTTITTTMSSLPSLPSLPSPSPTSTTATSTTTATTTSTQTGGSDKFNLLSTADLTTLLADRSQFESQWTNTLIEKTRQLERDMIEQKKFLDQERNEIDKLRKELEEDKRSWEDMGKRFTETVYSDPIILNIGGTLFQTTKTTLTNKINESEFFSTMFSGRLPLKLTKEGHIFIDRDSKVFEYVLSYLRGIRFNIMELDSVTFTLVEQDADFYGLKGLLESFGYLNSGFKWCHTPHYSIISKQTRLRKLANDGNCAVLTEDPLPATGVTVWHLRFITFSDDVLIGIAPLRIDRRPGHYSTDRLLGWYFQTSIGDSQLVVGPPDKQRGITKYGIIKPSTKMIHVEWDAESASLRFGADGEWFDIAFSGISKDQALYPTVICHYAGTEIEILSDAAAKTSVIENPHRREEF